MKVHLSWLLVFLTSCQSTGASSIDGGTMHDADRSVLDASIKVADAGPFNPGETPTTPIRPIAGELTFWQLELPTIARLGEAGIIVGPEGSIALLDVGNTNHADEVRDAVRELNTEWLTPANGFPARNPLQVEWIIITHEHTDHLGGFAKLFSGSEVLTGLKGVVHRGVVDLGEISNNYKNFCTLLTGSLAGVNKGLCETEVPVVCNEPGPAIATGCNGLRSGNLETSDDDSSNEPAYIDLDGATITFVGANGYFSNENEVVAIAIEGHETNDDENARSVAGIVSYGEFRYHFGGDLHGDSSDGTDVEGHLVATSGPFFYGPLGVDVIHSHHHGRKTGSNPVFVAAMAPADGRSRNVIAGISRAHIGSPAKQVLEAWGDKGRLGQGNIWVTTRATGGAETSELIDADGSLVIQTVQGGQGYWLQAVGDTLISHAFESVR